MKRIRVLLVDDEEDYVRAMAERMELRDLRSQVALSGEEALRVLAKDPPDVIVLDLRMPGMQGMEVLERVRREHPGIQVIILTGQGGDREEREARGLGAFDFLHKPVDTRHLVERIRGAWRRGLEAAGELIRRSGEEFDRGMTAAAMAEGGLPEDARAMVARRPRKAKGRARDGGLRVLFVDDEEDFVRTLAERMEMRDLGGEVALDGTRALDAIARDPPDVMVLDLKMPGMGGMEVLRRVREGYPEVQVVILTGHGSEVEREEALRLGAAAWLTKPVDIHDLMDAVRAAGRRARPRRRRGGR